MRLFLLAVLFTLTSAQSYGFCGFFVAKAGAKLFNKASKVVLVRDDNRTVITMANDYEGELQNFAIVIPVPEILEKKQINVGTNKTIARIDGFTSLRLAKYEDSNPCEPVRLMHKAESFAAGIDSEGSTAMASQALGVKVEASYSVGEYDIVILSAKRSNGLITWLKQNKYKMPESAAPVLKSYIKKGMKFFLAKVNLDRQTKTGLIQLRPLQIAFESEKFMLPIRLGMLNAKGDQDLLVYGITKLGRIETTNYPIKKIPANMEVPLFIKDEFPKFYNAVFEKTVKKHPGAAILEYAWDMGWCDPCADNPLTSKELRNLGVWWIPKNNNPNLRGIRSGQNAYVTRLHFRYNNKTFPEDLKFQTTKNKKNYQGRYVIRVPWEGQDSCEGAVKYRQNLIVKRAERAQALAQLTGWDEKKIRRQLKIPETVMPEKSWLDDLWR